MSRYLIAFALIIALSLIILSSCNSDNNDPKVDGDDQTDSDGDMEQEEDSQIADGDKTESAAEDEMDAESANEIEAEEADQKEECEMIFSFDTCEYNKCGGWTYGSCASGDCWYFQCTTDSFGLCIPNDYQCTDTTAKAVYGMTSSGNSGSNNNIIAEFANYCQLYLSKGCGLDETFTDSVADLISCTEDSDCQPDDSDTAIEVVKAYCMDNKCKVASCADSDCPNYRECSDTDFVCQSVTGNECNSVCLNKTFLEEAKK